MAIKTNIKKFFNREFEIYRQQKLEDDMGGYDPNYQKIAETIGRISIESRQREIIPDDLKDNVNVDFTIFMPHDTDIQRLDFVYFKGKTSRDEDRSFEVVTVRKPSDLNHHLEVLVKEKQPG